MNENIQKIIKNILWDIAVDMKDEFDQNFERQAFFCCLSRGKDTNL